MYSVELPLRITGAIRLLFLRAIRKGLTAQLLDALSQMDRHLAADPTRWGDPQFQLTNLNLMTYHRVEGPISISYAVDTVRRIVYVKSVQPFPGGGLESVP
jgi:hypothetical protein